MNTQVLIATVILIVAGALVSVQSPINAALGRGIGSAMGAATVSFAVGLVALLILTLAIGDGASLTKVGKVPATLLIGGLMGAVFVFSSLWAVPILGVLTTAMVVILGQMIAALVIDQMGAFGLAQTDISPQRLMAAALVLGGVVLSRF
ncbi:DMT family transporter [Roseovarius carneus]|uniref:DMT family transporter n=1 Tax=Roseovarius carneus TaxID=2853164 RepID=UPI001CCC129A|nr:DMT family transporter [Roseovarius carneus]